MDIARTGRSGGRYAWVRPYLPIKLQASRRRILIGPKLSNLEQSPNAARCALAEGTDLRAPMWRVTHRHLYLPLLVVL